MKSYTVKELVKIIDKLNPAEADLMGVSCQDFAYALKEKLGIIDDG
ncbi:MAG: hypothetical protein V3V96_15535 [Acidiferrobacterales bacterium]